MDQIARNAVASTSIAYVGYSETNATLEIQFRRGPIYRYFAVPRSIFAALLTSESKGAYFTRVIRGRYPYVRV